LAERLRAAVEGQTEVGGEAATVTVSVGVGLFRPPADDGLTILSRAGKACGKARREGGDRVASYVPLVPDAGSPERDSRLAGLVAESLGGGGLELMYQPIVAMRSAPGERYEASLRLRAPDGEYIPPFDFLPVARERGLMGDIDRWVIERALDELRAQRESHPGLRFFVHQTMASVVAEHWVLWLRDQIAGRDLIKTRPVLQFQYQDVLEHFDLAVARFGELTKLGIKVCILQFEDEPQALRLAESLPISLVKLAFKMLADMDSRRLTELVQRMHRHKISVIAAGIERPQTIAELWGCGVDFIQGNFLQLPGGELTFDFSEAALA
jgi:EAL domain-containing protein (putative c-di-GMP-specific phosphodiesterase class I)